MIFACLIRPGKIENQAIGLIRAIRENTGMFSQHPIWILKPDNSGELSEEGLITLNELDATLTTFQMDRSADLFPFAPKVYASAFAEAQAEGQGDTITWMDTDSIVIQEPSELLLRPEKLLGYRPVDHTLIGSMFDQPISPFWESIYDDCHVDVENLFPMTASVDENVIRPYFNAGMLVVHPETGLLRSWCNNFQSLYKVAHYEDFYTENILYKIFFHQAVLAGTILSSIQPADLQELPYLVNYPLHMHGDYPKDRKPKFLNEVITCRYDMLFESENWRKAIPINEPLKTWFYELGNSLSVN